MKSNLGFGQCSICNSKYGAQINRVKRDYPKLSSPALARLIKAKIPEEFSDVSEHDLAQRLLRHFNASHQPIDYNEVNFTDPKEENNIREELQKALKNLASGKVSWAEVLEKTRILAFRNMLNNPEAVKLKDYLKAENVQTNKEKLSLEARESSMVNLIAFIFGPETNGLKCPFCNHYYLPKYAKPLLEKRKGAGVAEEQIAEGEIVEAKINPNRLIGK